MSSQDWLFLLVGLSIVGSLVVIISNVLRRPKDGDDREIWEDPRDQG